MRSRNRKWSIRNGGNIGINLSNDVGASQRLLDRVEAITKSCTNDAAKQNDCLAHCEQRDLADKRGDGRFRARLDVHYQAHQTCLLTRAVYQTQGDLPSALVRLGHILEGATNMGKLLVAVDAVVDEIFECRQVLRLPDECAAWQGDSCWILKAYQSCGALSEAGCKAIVDHDNGQWNDSKYIHYCIVDTCPSGCTNLEQSRKIAKVLARTCMGSGCPVALLYRWKHVDAALAFASRGKGQHEILPRALKKMLTQRESEDDNAAANAAANATANATDEPTTKLPNYEPKRVRAAAECYATGASSAVDATISR